MTCGSGITDLGLHNTTLSHDVVSDFFLKFLICNFQMDTICVATAEVQDNNATPLQQHPNGYVYN